MRMLSEHFAEQLNAQERTWEIWRVHKESRLVVRGIDAIGGIECDTCFGSTPVPGHQPYGNVEYLYSSFFHTSVYPRVISCVQNLPELCLRNSCSEKS